MKKTLLTMAAAIALVGCSQEDLLTGQQNGKGNGAVGVNTFVSQGTRGVAQNEVGDLIATGNGFDLFAFESDGNQFMGTYDNGIEFAYNGGWDYVNNGEVKFWQQVGGTEEARNTVNFYAISPANTSGANMYSESQTIIDYTIAQFSENQVDLMYARNTGIDGAGISPDDTDVIKNGVQIDFYHALSQIVFCAKTHEDDVNYVTATVEGVEIVNLYDKGTFTFTDAPFGEYDSEETASPWSVYEEEGKTAFYAAQVGWNGENTTPVAVNESKDGATVDLTTSSTALLLLPQDITGAEVTDNKTEPTDGNTYIKVTCKVYYQGINDESPTQIVGTDETTADIYFPLTTTWKAGYKYIYTLVFSHNIADPVTINEDLYVGPWYNGENKDLPENGENDENNEPGTKYELIPTSLVSDGTNILIRNKDELLEARDLGHNLGFYYIGTELVNETYPVYSIEEADEDDEDGGIPAPEGVSIEDYPLEITFASASYKQTNDIDLVDESWIPMMIGSYDGGNKTISNLTVEHEVLSSGGYDDNGSTFGSMFYVANYDESSTASIKNLNMTNVKIGTQGQPMTYAAAIVARVNSFGKGIEISNCVVEGEESAIYGSQHAAGIITCGLGSPTLSVASCTNHADLSSNYNAGGITTSEANVTSCYNYGTVNGGDGYAAGIVPFANYNKTIQNCHNYGNISADIAGGIIAETRGCNITYSHNEGNVVVTDDTDTYYPGGIIGVAHPISSDEHIVITGCYNVKADVSLVGSIRHSHSYQDENTAIDITLTSCYNVPVSTSTYAMIGNIYQGTEESVIRNFTLTFTNCYYTMADKAYNIAENSNSYASIPESNTCTKLDARDPEYSDYSWSSTPMTEMNKNLSEYTYQNNQDESHPLKLSGEPTVSE